MSAPFMVSEAVGLVLAVILGVFFGLFLERGGMGNPHKLTGVFYLTDFSVPKVMFVAILVAATGLYLLADFKILDITGVWIVPTFFWPQLIGGALFGVGFLFSGYCPGTAVAGLASGRLDALVTMLGIGAGSLLFAIAYPQLEGFYFSTPMEDATLPSVLGISHWVVLAFAYLMAGGMFYLMERYETKR